MIRKPSQFNDFPKSLAPLIGFGPYAAVINRVIDGDTFDALVDLGFNIYAYAVIRVDGINSPELGTPQGDAAKVYAQQILTSGLQVVLHTCPYATTFGRYVARVTFVKDGINTDYGNLMITTGHAVVDIIGKPL